MLMIKNSRHCSLFLPPLSITPENNMVEIEPLFFQLTIFEQNHQKSRELRTDRPGAEEILFAGPLYPRSHPFLAYLTLATTVDTTFP